jgi:hypothetical protein
MQATHMDRRTAIKITLSCVGAALLPLHAQASEIFHESPPPPVLAPAMCAELHIADMPQATDVNG